MAITLSQFEQIDGLLTAFRNRGPLRHTAMTRAQVSDWMRHEWRLMDACVEAMGLDYVNSFDSIEDCAAEIVIKGLSSCSFVEDVA